MSLGATTTLTAVLAWLCVSSLAHAQPAQESEATAAPQLEPPKLREFVEAPYPEEAARERLDAKVKLRLTLDAEGHVTEAEVIEPVGHGFDEAARDAALRFLFDPAKRNGAPMPSRIVYLYEFRLPPPPAPPEPEPPPAAPEPPPAAPPTQTTPSTPTETPIEVTAQGTSEVQRRRQSAEAVQVLETERVQREAADMGEALARSEGVTVSRAGGLGSRARFSLAGLTDEQVRFFLDGVPLELAGFGSSLVNVPVNLIERVETFQGVVPIRFGADALGGAVQLVTDQQIHGTAATASYELGSFETHRLTGGVRHLVDSKGLLVRANGFVDSAKNNYPVDVMVADSQGRVQPMRLPRFHDAFRAAGLGVETGFVDQPWARRLLLRAFVSARDQDIQHDITMESVYGEVESSERSGGATLRFEQRFSQDLSADMVAGYTYRRTSFTDLGDCDYDWYGRCVIQLPQPGEIDFRAVDRIVGQHTGFARLNLEWGLATNHELRFSLAPTFVGRTGEDRQLRARQETDPLQGERNVFSLVSGVEYELDALEGRLENISFLKDYVQMARSDKLLPTGVFAPRDRNTHGFGVGDGLRLRLSDTLLAKASYEWAARLPRPDEIFGDGILVGDNLELEPERSHNLNLGLALDTRQTRAGALRASVTGFGRLADQLIILIGQENFFTYQNVFKARSLGVTGSVGWTSPGQYVALDGNATWQDFRSISDQGSFGVFEGQRIPNRPYLLGNLSARFQLGNVLRSQDELSLTWHSRYVHEFFRGWEKLGQQDSKQQIPSQFLHSAALTYVIRDTSNTMSWTIDVQNLTDASAYDFFGIQRPGRSVFAKFVVDLE
ncbi:TonB-dependent siderophore myxochelin receptor MxcH [Hyalangium versicolor]|uniref:TonB-dependent siderophore myxochelin receptor MxcH n=1 Tax=Hyalangium versicolor TaxID=2861190 RepID=UPI001CCECA34|nr:TonB-dependent siderophore myxochelin receptor MxcH [Hyalangium versicolor]